MIANGVVKAGGGHTFRNRSSAREIGRQDNAGATGELLGEVCREVLVVAPAGRYGDAPWPTLADGWPGKDHWAASLLRCNMYGKRTSEQLAGRWVGPHLELRHAFPHSEFIRLVVERASLSSAQVVVPKSVNGLKPSCALASQCGDEVQCAFHAGVRKVTEAMKRLRMEVLNESAWKRFDSENRLFWNMNTPEDYEEAHRLL